MYFDDTRAINDDDTKPLMMILPAVIMLATASNVNVPLYKTVPLAKLKNISAYDANVDAIPADTFIGDIFINVDAVVGAIVFVLKIIPDGIVTAVYVKFIIVIEFTYKDYVTNDEVGIRSLLKFNDAVVNDYAL